MVQPAGKPMIRSASSTWSMHATPAFPPPRSSTDGHALAVGGGQREQLVEQGSVTLLREVRAGDRAPGLDERRRPEAVVALPRGDCRRTERNREPSPSRVRIASLPIASPIALDVIHRRRLRGPRRVPVVRPRQRTLGAHPVGHPALVRVGNRRVLLEQLDALPQTHRLRRQERVPRVAVRRR